MAPRWSARRNRDHVLSRRAEAKYFGYAFRPPPPVLYFMLFRVPWRGARMLAFLNPESDPQGSGFHTIQSLIAVGTGGIRGLGFMEGREFFGVFFLRQPIEMHALDGQPVHTLFVLLSLTPKQHLELLARLAFLFRQKEFVMLLRQRSNP